MMNSVSSASAYPLNSSISAGNGGATGSSEVSSWVKERLSDLRSQYPTTSIAVSPAFLKKMEADPAVAAKGKELLDGIPAAQDWLQNQVQQNGMKLLSSGMSIDDQGNMSSWSVTQTSSDPKTDSSEKSPKQKLKEWLEKRAASEKQESARAAVEDLFSRIKDNSPAQKQAASASNRVDIYA